MKLFYKVIFVSFLTLGFSLVQAILTLGDAITATSAKNADDFWAVDEIIIWSLPLVPFVVLMYMLIVTRMLKSLLWLIPTGIVLACYWGIFIDKPIFEERDAAWSTWSPDEIRDHVILFFLIPAGISASAFCWILKKMAIKR